MKKEPIGGPHFVDSWEVPPGCPSCLIKGAFLCAGFYAAYEAVAYGVSWLA